MKANVIEGYRRLQLRLNTALLVVTANELIGKENKEVRREIERELFIIELTIYMSFLN